MADDGHAGDAGRRRRGCGWRVRRPARARLTIPGDPRGARAAVSALFFVNGALISTVIPRLPAIKADLALSNGALGVAVGASAFGALVTGPLAGAAVARVGSARLAVLTGVAYGAAISLFGVVGVWSALAATFLLIGALDVLMDVGMNTHGLRVQRSYQRSIFNGFHAWWSIGATAGGAAGAAAAALDVPLTAHLLAVGLVLAAAVIGVRPWLLPGPEEPDGVGEPAGGLPGAVRLVRALAPFALLSVAAAVVEDVPGSFGAVYLRDWLGASAGVAGLGYVGFVAGLTAGRLGADRLVDRYGAAAVVRAGNTLAAVGLGTALVVDNPAAAVAGFTCVGLGASSTIPALFVAAGSAAGRTADGIALVSWATRFGFLLSPIIVGVVADASNLPIGVALCVVAATTIALTADRTMPHRQPSVAPSS